MHVMNNTIEIEVTLLETTKTFTVTPVAVTGIENKAHALMALRQAFIMSGKPLAQDSLLARYPVPDGTKQAEWLKTLEGKVEISDFPTAEAIWQDAQGKAIKAYEPKASSVKASLALVLAELEKAKAELALLKAGGNQ